MAGAVEIQAGGIVATVGTLAFMFLGPVASVIPWEPFSRDRLAELRQKGATVLVDFSADWCMTCKYNLATAIETSKVKAEIERNHVVPLLADWTDGSPEIKAMLESLQSKSIPVLAVFPPIRSGNPLPVLLARVYNHLVPGSATTDLCVRAARVGASDAAGTRTSSSFSFRAMLHVMTKKHNNTKRISTMGAIWKATVAGSLRLRNFIREGWWAGRLQ